MITDIMEEVTGLTMDGYDVMTQRDFEDFLAMADEVPYQVDDDISYRNSDGVLQVIEGGTTEIDSDEAVALLTYLDGTETEESNRLERTNVYLQSFFTRLFEENDGSAVFKKYSNLAQSGDGRDLADKEQFFEKLDPDNMTIRIMQGSEANGVFTVDSQMVQLQVSTLAQQAEKSDGGSQSADDDEQTGSGSASTADSREYSIELYNSAYVAGLAGEWESYLEAEGYTISLVDSYQDEGPLSTTRIVVTEEGMGEDLLTYFPDADIEVGEIDTGGDIQVYIGTDSTDVGGGDSTVSDDPDEDTYGEDDSSYDEEEDSYSDDEEDSSDEDSYGDDEEADSSDEDSYGEDDEADSSDEENDSYGGSYNFDTDSAR